MFLTSLCIFLKCSIKKAPTNKLGSRMELKNLKKTYYFILGIDSGINGGLTLVNALTGAIEKKYVMPKTTVDYRAKVDPEDLYYLVSNILYQYSETLVVIEETQARSQSKTDKDGKKNFISGKAKFSLGRSLGQLEAIMIASKANVFWLTPGKWMPYLKRYTKQKDPTLRQKEAAAMIWPGESFLPTNKSRHRVAHSGILAAALIAHVGNCLIKADSASSLEKTKKELIKATEIKKKRRKKS